MKYKLRKDLSINYHGRTLYRIEALKYFNDVEVGQLGGWVEKESNLSQDGDCWVYDDAEVYGDARVYDNAEVFGNARVYDNAEVYGDAKVYGNAEVFGNVKVWGNAIVYGNALVSDNAKVYGNARVYDNAKVSDNAYIFNNQQLYISNVATITAFYHYKTYYFTNLSHLSLNFSYEEVKSFMNKEEYKATIDIFNNSLVRLK